MKTVIMLIVVSGFAGPASAGIEGFRLGTEAPPADIVGRAMTPAPFDDRTWSLVPSLPDGLGGDITFSEPMLCLQVAHGWRTWSHGYTGNVYRWETGGPIRITFSPGTKAVYLYAEPGPGDLHDITVTASDGESLSSFTDAVHGESGASGWAFYSTGGKDVAWAQIGTDTSFGVGEFATSRVPAPGGPAVVGLGGLVVSHRRRG